MGRLCGRAGDAAGRMRERAEQAPASVNPTSWWSDLPTVTPSASATPSAITWPIPVSPIADYGDGYRFQAGKGALTMPLTIVTSTQEGFDRIVVECADEGVLGFQAEYVDGAIEAGSRSQIRLSGSAVLQVMVQHVRTPLAGQIPLTPGKMLATGTVVHDLNVAPMDLGQIQLLIGVDATKKFRIFTVDHPSRLVIDVEH